MKLKKPLYEKIKGDKVLIGKIAKVRNVSLQTAERWVVNNSKELLHIAILTEIKTHLAINETVNEMYL
jgi:hypothetical protein